MKRGQTIRQFANEICLLETELIYADHRTVQEDKRFVLLNGLRAEFSVKKAILQEKDIQFEEMVSALEITESELSTYKANGQEDESVFLTENPSKKCQLC